MVWWFVALQTEVKEIEIVPRYRDGDEFYILQPHKVAAYVVVFLLLVFVSHSI